MAALPKLSYVLLSHNRERYIRAAVESALAQDYEGELEYIFSDDCSTDRTFEIIKECVSLYKGPRRIVVTQPSSNLKTAGNFNHALTFVQSDWVVRADDDDISTIDRCRIIGHIVNTIPNCSYIATETGPFFTDDTEDEAVKTSSLPCSKDMHPRAVDIRNAPVQECLFRPNAYSYKAWNMASIRIFGQIPADACWADDYVLFFRASLLGKGVLVDNAPAVLIRNNSLNQSLGKEDGEQSYSTIMRRERFFDAYQNRTYEPLMHTCKQLKEYAHSLSPEEQDAVASYLSHMEEEIHRMGILRSFWRKGCTNRLRITRMMGWKRPYDYLRCLPMPLFAAALTLYRFAQQKQQHPSFFH